MFHFFRYVLFILPISCLYGGFIDFAVFGDHGLLGLDGDIRMVLSIFYFGIVYITPGCLILGGI